MADETKQETAEGAVEDVEQAVEQLKEAAERADEVSQQAIEASQQLTEASQQLIEASQQVGGYGEQLAAAASGGPSEFLFLFTIFILAIVIGYYVVWSVTPALHTPLMAVTNAISSVVIVGALIALGADLTQSVNSFWPKLFGFMGVALASVNIVGGFLVTQRMLAMYKKKES
jgi:proton-translocating NAD(P)+ transhydrogenase subunit alpha